MKSYPTLLRSFLYPTYAFARGKDLLRHLSEYEGHMTWTSEQVAEHQLIQLQKLIKHAFDSTEYYRKTWAAAGLTDPQEVRSLADFSKLPLITKSDVRSNYADFVSAKHTANIRKATGGSTGEPFHFELDSESNSRREAVMWRGYGLLGAGFGTRTLYLWGADVGKSSFIRSWKDRLYHAFYNRKMLNSFDLAEDNFDQYIDEINQFKPEAMVSYVNPLFELARYVLESRASVFSPGAILTGAEPLYEHQREAIQKAFNCPVYNTYGCREFMLIAAECRKYKSLHINSDHLLTQTVDHDSREVFGQSGDLVITDLYNFGMPLIRYINGDSATLTDDQCECGSPFPIMRSIEGRKLDMIKTRSGRRIPGELFPHLFKEFSAIRRFQIIQPDLDRVVLKIVAGDDYSNEVEKKIISEIGRYSHDELALDFEYVSSIPLTASGKHRVTVSEL